jgi:hypothetical protein
LTEESVHEAGAALKANPHRTQTLTEGFAMRHSPEEDRGFRIEKIPLKGRMGLVLAAGVMIFFLIALPAVRWFFILTLPAGILVGVVLYFIHRR